MSKKTIIIFIFILTITFLESVAAQNNYKVFTLKKSIETGLKNNFDIQIAKHDKKIAQKNLTLAKSSLYPQISANVHKDKLGNVGTSSFGIGINGENIGYSATAVAQIYTFGKRKNTIKMAELGIDNAGFQKKQVIDKLIFDITNSFYSIILSQKLLDVAKEAYSLADSHVLTAEKRFKQGLVSEFDILRAKVERSNKVPEIIKSKNMLALCKENFKTILNINNTGDIDVAGDLIFNPVKISEQEAVSLAFANRSELHQLNTAYKITEHNFKLSKSQHNPDINLTFKYDKQKPDYETFIGNLSGKWYAEWLASVSVGVPVFTGFRTTAQISKSKIELQKLQTQIDKLKSLIKLEIKKILKDINESSELIEAAEETVKLAEKALHLAKVSYNNGLATSLDISEAQLKFTAAKTNYYNSIFKYIVKVAELEKAIGVYKFSKHDIIQEVSK